MSGKLSWFGAYNRSQTLGPIVTSNRADDEMENASYTQSERKVKILKAENAKLKREYDELNATLKQLLRETSHEKFDERRINLLKLQIIQLERQVAVLNEALGCRHEAMMEVENMMAWLADKLRSYISADVKGPMIPIARVDLMSLVESSESARIKLFKAIEGCGKECVGKDLIYLNPFIGGKYIQGEQLSLLDICLDRMNYMNFRHVACLESKLCTLYKDLMRVFEQLDNITKAPTVVRHRNFAEASRQKTAILRACMSLRDAADDLLALSLLCPSAPWPSLKRPVTKQVSVDRITSALPSGLPKLKQEEISHIIEASIGVCNHRYLLLEKEKAVLKEELTFHRASHDLQVQYMTCLFDAVRKGYGEFENSAKETFARPIKTMLDAYRKLKDSASEQALRDFLVVIKDNEEQLSSVEEMLEEYDFEKDGACAFSKFGSEFFSKLDALVEQCQKERDQAFAARRDVAEEQHRKDAELQQLIEDLEIKYGKQWSPLKTNAAITGNEHSVNQDQIKTESIESSIMDDKKDHLAGSSRQSSAKGLKDDHMILRSFLYSADKISSNAAPKEEYSMNTSRTNVSPCDETSETPMKGVKKKSRKAAKWRPDKEWISDFSGSYSIENSDVTYAGSADDTHKPKKVQSKLPKVCDNDFSQPTSDSINLNSPKLTGTLSFDGDSSTTKDPGFPLTKGKKHLTYEPRLYVANRTLKLRRAGSVSSIASLNQAVSDKNESDTMEEISNKTKNTSEVHSKPIKSKDSQQKPPTIHKRNSWR